MERMARASHLRYRVGISQLPPKQARPKSPDSRCVLFSDSENPGSVFPLSIPKPDEGNTYGRLRVKLACLLG
jgi:hypothetical protein